MNKNFLVFLAIVAALTAVSAQEATNAADDWAPANSARERREREVGDPNAAGTASEAPPVADEKTPRPVKRARRKPVEKPVPEPVEKPKLLVEAPKPSPAAVPAPAAEVKPAAVQEIAKDIKSSSVSKTVKVEYSTDKDIERLKFKFGRVVPAAVFERFGYYWLVFDTDDTADLPDGFKKSRLFESGKKQAALKTSLGAAGSFLPPAKSPLVFVLALTKDAYAMAGRNGNEWTIEFDPNIKYEQDKPLKPEEKPDSWQIAAGGIADRITVKDEFTNDYLEIFPLAETGGVVRVVNADNFVLEKTNQGVVIKPVGEIQTINNEKDKIKIIKSGHPVPAAAAVPAPAATPAPAANETAAPVAAPVASVVQKPMAPVEAKPIFPFEKWKQLASEDYRNQEKKLQNGDRFEFGKFLFTQGLYPEAAVNLEGVKGFQASFLTGASYFMLGRYEDAIKVYDTLSLPAGVDANELLLWKAAADYELGKVRPTASSPPDIAKFALPANVEKYPDSLRVKLLFDLAQRLMDDGKFDDAQAYLDNLQKTGMDDNAKNYLKYLQAKVYDHQNKRARAREIWADVQKTSADRESRAKASYEVIMQDYNTGVIKADEVIKRLNDIRILWRGDMFEYKLLGQLADLYAQTADNYDALHVYKEILSSFPRYPDNLQIATKMRAIYENVLSKDLSDKDKTFRAVTIYYEFEELKPVGQKGDAITLQLADALAKYDLLEDSAKVLQKYEDSLTDGGQKAEIGTRIAILYFINNKPKDAIKALKDSQAPNLPSYLAQERKILEIRCLIEIGDLEKAASMLSSIPDEQANRFKTDIDWKQKKWQEMVDTYGVLAQKNEEDVMRLGIAYALLDNSVALKGLKKQYGDMMAKSPFAQNFDFVSDTDNVDYRHLDQSLKLDQTEKILQNYRDKIKDKGLANVTKETAPAAAAKPDIAVTPSATPAPAAATPTPAAAAAKK